MHAREAALIATFAGLIAVLGMLPPIPLSFIPVPITAQSLGVMIAGCLLRPKSAVYSLLIFLFLVAIGFPLLSGGRGGISVFFSPSAGFLLSWPISALCIAYISKLLGSSILSCAISTLVGGILVIYPIGIFLLSLITHIDIEVALFASLVFLPGDILKIFIASIICAPVLRAYPSIKL